MANQDESLYKSGVVEPENPSIVGAINRMIDRGYSKEYTQKITGAPYEVVDKHFKVREKGGKNRISINTRDDE